jgi:hypothetical protein
MLGTISPFGGGVRGGPDVTKYQSSNNFNVGIENIYYFGTSNTLYPLRD